MSLPRVLIIGAGFGGLYAARTLAGKNVSVLLIDRHNYHTFTPLLYQVATCGLDPSEISYPVRQIFYDQANISFLLGEVTAINPESRQVTIQSGSKIFHEGYDYLIVAAGSVTNYFGSDSLAASTFELKKLSDAVLLRNHILKLFEQAAWTEDAAQREALTTLVVIGGGPTGLETAGALYELYNDVLRKEYRQEGKARVILIEAADRLLLPFPEPLQKSALEQLTSLGVEVILNSPVESAGLDFVRLRDGRMIPTHTIIWSAGVKASPVASMLGVELLRGGRVPVKPTLEVSGKERIYVVGDMAYLEDAQGQPYPMLIPVAKQQGKLAAENILHLVNGEPQDVFVYYDRGIMATIGRSRAVAWIYNRVSLHGYIAWLAWLFLHLIWLLGFRNRLNVLVNWVWNYWTYDRSVRLILEPASSRLNSSEAEVAHEAVPPAAGTSVHQPSLPE
jgi:NADH dehydrogenase